MNNEQLKTTIEKHQKWLNKTPGGKRADLEGANLRWTYLRGTNLEGANLARADIVGANLRWANLERANLEGANLEKANLEKANLEKANLTNTKGILGFYLGKHFGYAWRNEDNQIIVKVGCRESEIGQMIKGARVLGEKEGYSKNEIALYTDMLKLIKKRGLKDE